MGTKAGLTKDAGWEVGVSRTLAVPLEQVWDFLTSRDGQAVWLGTGAELGSENGAGYRTKQGVTGEVRSRRDRDRIRLTWRPADWDHDTTVQVTVSTPASGSGTTLRFHQEHLADSAERERQRAHWQSVVDRVEELLT